MTSYSSRVEEVRAQRSSRERVAHLLSRYPHVSDGDRDAILSFLKGARHLEIGLLSANDNVGPQLDAFMSDHKSHFGPSWLEASAVAGGIAALLAILWLIWGAFA
ncbi:MAG TPA: hypothetical protein VJM15_04685 [Sphingomicrobium sp.]|nr:hypothetical protein [Sphingomicrobium sp.]